MTVASFIPTIAGLLLAPLTLGAINRVKARVAGRTGQPLLQTYFDLWKLLHKGAVYSETTTWAFRLGPVAGVASAVAALLITPLGGVPALASFQGDVILFALLLGTLRFTLMNAALDTGSAFEGMGASREAAYSALLEPALFLALASLGRSAGTTSLTDIYAGLAPSAWGQFGPVLALAFIALLVAFLVENARIPVDDPNTHLELTMIHEVMVLDHSGPDFAFIQYASALKHWLFGALIAGIAIPIRSEEPLIDAAATTAGIFVLAMVVGVIESSMARLRLLRVPQMIIGAAALAVVALVASGVGR